MKFEIEGPFRKNLYNLMREAGYCFLRKNENELEFTRPPKGFPRFHLFINVKDDLLVFKLHLDQKKPIYQTTPAHAGEYNGEVVEEEGKRIKQFFEKYRIKK